MDQQPFAAGFRTLDGAAGERRVVIDARERCESGFEAGAEVAAEGALQCAGRIGK